MNDSAADRPDAASGGPDDERPKGEAVDSNSDAHREDQGEATEPEGETIHPNEGPPSSTENGTPEKRILIDPAKVRRAPRYGRFGLVGGIVGVVFCLVVVAVFARPTEFLGLPGLFLLLTVFLVPVFVLLGLAVALLVDYRSRRRMR